MKVLVLEPGTRNVHLSDRPEPQVSRPTDVKLRVLRVGICGTDREEASGGRADAPPGRHELVIGHEMLGRVVAVGDRVTRVATGDLGVVIVRRPCGACAPCDMGRQDMCTTGRYTERGIKGLDGFQAEYVIDDEMYVVKAPPELEATAVLTEPLSVAEKAIDVAVRAQVLRLPDASITPEWLNDRACLVAGLGPVGLLAALALRLRGARVFGMDVVDASSPRPEWLRAIGGTYIDGRQVKADQVDDAIGPMEVIVEATGVPALEFNLIDALAPSGVYVLTGIPGGSSSIDLPAAELIRQLVLDNQVLVGSVNAAAGHYRSAITDLDRARRQWGDHVEKLITHRHRFDDLGHALTEHSADEIKAVVEWS